MLLFIPTLVGAAVLIFLAMHLIPGSVAYAILGEDASPENVLIVEKQLGLDKPQYIQFVTWMRQMVTWDLGDSLLQRVPVTDLIREAIPISVTLAIYSMVLTLILAIPIGILAAVRQDTWVDYVLRAGSITGLALPTFWTGIIILFVLIRLLGWSPSLDYVGFFDNPWRNFLQMIWPALAVSSYLIGVIVRMTRSALLEVLREDYVRTARAKGLAERVVLVRHALANAMLPVVTIAGIQFAHMLGGFIVTEQVFNLHGLGMLIVNSALARDYPVIQNLFLFTVVLTLTVNLLVDLSYGILDPRIRQS
ncbi:MAG: ABC transporter permease [SAR202 cluster bacterium]|nr:ABC transporter permease [SAR202 cluster bacterium]